MTPLQPRIRAADPPVEPAHVREQLHELEGSGGIPGGGLVIALIFVQAFHLPLEIAVIVGGIYRLIDMGSTTINVTGDMVGTAIVAHSERDRL